MRWGPGGPGGAGGGATDRKRASGWGAVLITF